MNSTKIYSHPTITGALLIVSPLGNIAVTNECAFKTTITPAEGATEVNYGTTEVILMDNAKINSANLLNTDSVNILAMFLQEKVEDEANQS